MKRWTVAFTSAGGLKNARQTGNDFLTLLIECYAPLGGHVGSFYQGGQKLAFRFKLYGLLGFSLLGAKILG